MANITAAMVKELREKTGAGMMDCKSALNEVEGDIEAAIEAQGFFPLDVSGSTFAQGSVTNPATFTDAGYTAVAGDGTNGYCLVTHG